MHGPCRTPACLLALLVPFLAATVVASDLRPSPAPSDVASPPPDAVRTASNLACRVLRPGTGTRHAQPEDVVEIRWSAWTTDGRAIGASADAQAEALPMRRLLPGLREAVALMTEGESARFWLPKELAYGDGVGGRPAGTLVFDVELVKIQ